MDLKSSWKPRIKRKRSIIISSSDEDDEAVVKTAAANKTIALNTDISNGKVPVVALTRIFASRTPIVPKTFEFYCTIKQTTTIHLYVESEATTSGGTVSMMTDKPPEIDLKVPRIRNVKSISGEKFDLTLMRHVLYTKDVKNINTWKQLARLRSDLYGRFLPTDLQFRCMQISKGLCGASFKQEHKCELQEFSQLVRSLL